MAEKKITDNVIKAVKDLIKDGVRDSEVRKALRSMSGLSKSRGNEVFNKIKNSIEFDETLKIGKPAYDKSGYLYNISDDSYNFGELELSGETVRLLQKLYSENKSVDDIGHELNLDTDHVIEVKKRMGISRRSIPLTNEFIELSSIDESRNKLISLKKQKIIQAFKESYVRENERDANKWRKFSEGTLDKISEFLSSWTPPKRNNVPYAKKSDSKSVFCVGLNDTHISESFDKAKAFGGTKWDTNEALKTIDNYSNQIRETIENRKEKFGKILVFVNGDYLNSCVDGKTRKGTQLNNDAVNEEMFEAGLSALIRFVENLSEIAPVEVFTQKGNHDSFLLTYLAIAAEKYFKDVDTVKFNISKAWATLYRVNNVAIVLSHGGHDTLNRAEFPNANTPGKLKEYVQDLLLARRDELVGVKQTIIVTGHRHVFSQIDMGSFEFFCFGAMPASGDYENANNWHSTPRQNCIVLDENRLKETLHFYFD